MSGSLTLLKEKHIRYIESLDTKKHNFEYWLTEHLRLNGIYWGLTALCVLDSPETFVKGTTNTALSHHFQDMMHIY